MKISARNCLKGTIIAIKEGPVTTEVTIETEAKEKSDQGFVRDGCRR